MEQKNKIIGIGSFVPTKVISNDDLAKIMDTSDEWIQKRTGIKYRHIAEDNEVTSDLALKASLNAIENASITVSEIDLIIVATSTPDKTFPSTATILQKKLGASSASFDISAACSGFVYAITMADAMLKTKGFNAALVVGAETFSRLIDYADRSTAVLFGDGAGAFILRKSDNESGIYFNKIYSDANYSDALHTTGGVSSTKTAGSISMNGREVFRLGIEKSSAVIKDAISQYGDVDWIVPHQSNMRMVQAISQNTGIPLEKFLTTIDVHANTSAASIPLTFDHYVKNEQVKSGERIIFVSVGAGFTWGGLSIIY